jgi:dUTP pyrophosphatase
MILYPYSKAIAQALVVPVPKIEVEEISYTELKEIKSERGMGSLGSSNK